MKLNKKENLKSSAKMCLEVGKCNDSYNISPEVRDTVDNKQVNLDVANNFSNNNMQESVKKVETSIVSKHPAIEAFNARQQGLSPSSTTIIQAQTSKQNTKKASIAQHLTHDSSQQQIVKLHDNTQYIIIPATVNKNDQEQIKILKSPGKPNQKPLTTGDITCKMQAMQKNVKKNISPQSSSSKLITQQVSPVRNSNNQPRPSPKSIVDNDLIPLHSGSKLLISKTAISTIFTPNVKNYTARLINHLLKADGLIICELENIRSIITHVTQVFNRRGNPVTELDVEKYVMIKLQKSVAPTKK